MSRKYFKEDENGYHVEVTVTNGGRVVSYLSRTEIVLDKEYNLVSYVKHLEKGEKVTEPDMSEVKKAITYAKGQVKKLNQEDKLHKVICQDGFRGPFYTKEVHKTSSGGYNTREAETRKEYIAKWTPKAQKKIDEIKKYEDEIQEMRKRLSDLEYRQYDRREKVAAEIFKK